MIGVSYAQHIIDDVLNPLHEAAQREKVLVEEILKLRVELKTAYEQLEHIASTNAFRGDFY